jgi:hypothetical protein
MPGGFPWTMAELKVLDDLRAKGLKQREMALILGRTERSVCTALTRYSMRSGEGPKPKTKMMPGRPQPAKARARPAVVDLAGYPRALVVWAVRHKDANPVAAALVAKVADANRRMAA